MLTELPEYWVINSQNEKAKKFYNEKTKSLTYTTSSIGFLKSQSSEGISIFNADKNTIRTFTAKTIPNGYVVLSNKEFDLLVLKETPVISEAEIFN